MDILGLVKAGRVFKGSTNYAGVTIPIYSSTTGHKFCLWNVSPNRLIVPLTLDVSQTDASTPAITGLALGELGSAGYQAGTGSPVAAWTDTTPTSLPGAPAGVGCSARFALAADLTSACSVFKFLGLSQDSATPGTGIVTSQYKFDQSYAIFPGALVSLLGAPLAFGQDMAATITWAELDL